MDRLPAGRVWKLSPSDLTFLFEECRRCFWLKVVGGLPRPRSPFPRIFSLLDSQTKNFFAGKRTEEVTPALPPGRVYCGDRRVRSRPLDVPGHAMQVQLEGRLDTALLFDDDTFGIVDFKTTQPKQETVSLYGRQLHSYALAAENPEGGGLHLARVSVLGLLCVEPVGVTDHESAIAYLGEPRWVEVPRDDDAFMAFLLRVLLLLDRTEPPEATTGCAFCIYLDTGTLALITRLFER